MPIPQYDNLFNPALLAIKKLGGSASIAELNEEVTKSLHLNDKDLVQPHGVDDRQTELEYRLAWARTYLKKAGLLDNSERGVWSLTAKGQEVDTVKPREVVRSMTQNRPVRKKPTVGTPTATSDISVPEIAEAVLEQTWKDQLLVTLRALPPAAFERLCQRLLRESGFVEVHVTGRSGDGGIDGVGRVKIGGLLGFPIVFQCKRYQGSISPNMVREFRGAMMGRADRGLLITTGTFTSEAKREAVRDGAQPIDLLDGDELMEKLKDLRLGVGVKMIEEVSVLDDWFREI
ncbi:MAG: restriction endonuclease [Chloroflexia bacterium]